MSLFEPFCVLNQEQPCKTDEEGSTTNYVIIMAPAIIAAAVLTALYGKTYDKKGFLFSMRPVVVMLSAGYVILYFCRSIVPVLIGSMLMLGGYLTGMSVFGAMIRDNIPENRSGQFQGVRIIGQVFVPGLIGPAIGAAVLRNAEEIVNSDGTTSFLPNRSIWVAAFAIVIILCGLLMLLSRKIESSKESA